jgi:hypothetical protein
VNGSVSLISKTSETFKIDVESISISINGSLAILNRQNNKEVEEISKYVKNLQIISIKDMVLAKGKTL